MSFRGFAIIVTVDRHASPGVGNLGSSVNEDGDALRDILSDADLCGYATSRITRLSGPAATCTAILSAIADVAARATIDDPVLFYFSGHGDPPDPASGAGTVLLPYDFDPVSLANGLSANMLAVAWDAVPSHRKLAIVDACYAGGIGIAKAKHGGAGNLSAKLLDQLANGRGSVVIASSRASEPSAILHGDRLSLFTKHLVGGLQGFAGHDANGFIRVFDLFTYVAMSVRKEAPDQHPGYSAAHQEDNFPVSFCAVRSRRKSRERVMAAVGSSEVGQLSDLFASLYPLGPLDQVIWERAGGDVSRLVISRRGRTDWFTALQTLSKGGGGVAISQARLIKEALQDYPHHPELKQLQG